MTRWLVAFLLVLTPFLVLDFVRFPLDYGSILKSVILAMVIVGGGATAICLVKLVNRRERDGEK